MLSGSTQSLNHEFIKVASALFWNSNPNIDSQSFKLKLTQHVLENHPQLEDYLYALKAQNLEDKYGTLTLTTSTNNQSLELKFRKKDAYGGPKTEQYLDRITLKVNAAMKFCDDKMTPAQAEATKVQLARYLAHYHALILKECPLSQSRLKKLHRDDKEALRHFNEQHQKALPLLALFMADLCNILKPHQNIKKELYQIERELMSGARPTRVNVRKINTPDAREWVAIDVVAPLTPEQTLSSAKKDTMGVANWLGSSHLLYERNPQGQLALRKQTTQMRSASLVPHQLLAKDSFSQALAFETSKRIIVNNIIPHLIARMSNPLPEPIVINYELLTLLSPISAEADRLGDPDYGQFMAMKEAIQHFHGRAFPVTLPNGDVKQVKFNAIYHNYGVNTFRGFATEEQANIRAYNQIIDRSIHTLTHRFKDPINRILMNMPNHSPEDQITITKTVHELKLLRMEIDANRSKMSNADHQKLMHWHNLNLQDSLPAKHRKSYEHLKQQFNEIQRENRSKMLKIEAKEKELHEMESKLQEERQTYLDYFRPLLEKKLSTFEHESSHHLRALLEYNRLIGLGHDQFSLKDRLSSRNQAHTKLNYEVQSYIAILNGFHPDTMLHLTCKSGKDRTNAALEKQNAKQAVIATTNQMPKSNDERMRQFEAQLFDDGLLLGPGNDICGDNMKPGAQQLSSIDVPSTINVDPMREMAKLQKGIDSLTVGLLKRHSGSRALLMSNKHADESQAHQRPLKTADKHRSKQKK